MSAPTTTWFQTGPNAFARRRVSDLFAQCEPAHVVTMPDPGNVGDVDPVSTSLDPRETDHAYADEGPPPPDAPPPLDGWLLGRAIDAQRPPDPGPDTLELAQTFRHSGWAPQRGRVAAAFQRCGVPLARRARFASCGSTYYVLRSKEDPTRYRLACKACHDRFCRPCANERSRTVAHNVKDFLKGQACRFVTLTLRNNGEPLRTLLDKLYASFTALRKTPIWKSTQTGGVAFLEIKRSEKTGLWHPHFHVLTQGKYIDHAKLRTAWAAVTKDSHVVDVRLVKSHDEATAYVTKYASKPLHPTVTDTDEHLDEAIHSLHGRKMILTYGKWRGLRVTSKPDPDKWEKVCTLDELATRVINGDLEAPSILQTLVGDAAPQWLAAARRRDGCLPTAADTAWSDLYFANTDAIPF